MWPQELPEAPPPFGTVLGRSKLEYWPRERKESWGEKKDGEGGRGEGRREKNSLPGDSTF